MGESTEQLSHEIADTRQSMTANVDALQDKVSPAAIVERRKEAARGRVRSARDKVMGTAHHVGSSTSGTASSATSSAHGAVDSVKGTAQDAVSSTQDRVEGSPLAAGLVAFGAGMIVSALIPASDKEARVASQVVDVAKEHGQPVVDEAKSMAQDVAQNVKESAADAVAEVKDSASESADKVATEGKSGVDEGRSHTQSCREPQIGPSLGGGPICVRRRSPLRVPRLRGARHALECPGRGTDSGNQRKESL